MKKICIIFICLSVSVIAARAQDKKNPPPPPPPNGQPAPPPGAAAPAAPDPDAPAFKFKHGDTYDFGEVPEGPNAECEFEFKNTGKSPLIIKDAHGSCGCTIPEWPKDPIPPGKKSSIKVTYHTQGRPGPIHKDVIISYNGSTQPYLLHITGTVKRSDTPPPPAPNNAPPPPAH